jgi:hypothetical protein
MDMYGDEMGMEDAYGGYGGYGGPPTGSRARGTGTPSADAIQTYGSGLISLMDGLDLSPFFIADDAITVESGPVLQREAEEAFKAGNEGLGLELMFGYMATEYKDAVVALQTVKYSKAVKRPVWAIRWGVSMAVRGDATDPQPIREGATPNRRSLAGGGGGPGDYDGYGGMDEEMMDQGMDDEMEAEMEREMAEMEEQMSMEMDMEMEMGMGGRGFGGRGSGGRGPGSRSTTAPAQPSIPAREMLSAEVADELDKTIGLVAKVTAEEFSKRFQRGDFGPVFATVTPPETPNTSISEELNDALAESPEPLPMWQPGIVFLGRVDAYDQALPAARANKLDLVLHFDVVLKQGRNDMVQNISRCRLIPVKTGKSIVVSKGMDNREAMQLASVGRMDEREYVTEQLSNLFAIIDRDVKVIDLPRLSPDVARNRIASLLSSPASRTLRTLAEVRLYQVQGLIDQSEVETAFDIVGGTDGLTLLHGADKERVAMARKWAVKSQDSGR